MNEAALERKMKNRNQIGKCLVDWCAEQLLEAAVLPNFADQNKSS